MLRAALTSRSREAPQSSQAKKVQVLDGDDVERAGEGGGDPVEVKRPGLGDPTMKAGSGSGDHRGSMSRTW